MAKTHRTRIQGKDGVTRTYNVRKSPETRGYRFNRKKSAWVPRKARERPKGDLRKVTLVLYGSDYDASTQERFDVEWRVTFTGHERDIGRVKDAVSDWFAKRQGHYESKGKGQGQRWVVPDHRIGIEEEGTGAKRRSIRNVDAMAKEGHEAGGKAGFRNAVRRGMGLG